VVYGLCHCRCGDTAVLAGYDARAQNLVRGEPRLYARGHKGGTMTVADDGKLFAATIDRVGLKECQVSTGAGLGKGVVSELLDVVGYRIRRERCESIVRFLRDELERRELDASAVTLERLFTEDRPAGEVVGDCWRRRERRRPAVPPSARGDGAHFRAGAERARATIEAEKLWTQGQASAFLGLSRPTFIHMENRGRIKSERRKIGTVLVRAYVPRDVRLLGVDLRASDRAWDQRRRNPLAVYEWAIGHGTTRAEARARAEQATEQLAAWGRIRVGAGRPKSTGPPEYHLEWANRFAELEAELSASHQAFHVLGDAPPTKLGVAALVAEDDYAARPERWDYDPREVPGNAARRVWMAVKPLLNAVSGIRPA
jgi:hypothetical protein